MTPREWKKGNIAYHKSDERELFPTAGLASQALEMGPFPTEEKYPVE
jgi:hypothetical protein